MTISNKESSNCAKGSGSAASMGILPLFKCRGRSSNVNEMSGISMFNASVVQTETATVFSAVWTFCAKFEAFLLRTSATKHELELFSMLVT